MTNLLLQLKRDIKFKSIIYLTYDNYQEINELNFILKIVNSFFKKYHNCSYSIQQLFHILHFICLSCFLFKSILIKVVKMFGVMISIFCICWLPYHLYFLYSYMNPGWFIIYSFQHINLSLSDQILYMVGYIIYRCLAVVCTVIHFKKGLRQTFHLKGVVDTPYRTQLVLGIV